jgi:hypothetical protein
MTSFQLQQQQDFLSQIERDLAGFAEATAVSQSGNYHKQDPNQRYDMEGHNDEHEDDDHDEVGGTGRIVAPMSRSAQISNLEDRLSQYKSELSRLRQERDKQRIELNQQVKQNENLQIQRESRRERMKLQEQIEELQDVYEAKLLLKQMAKEELEKTLAHYRRLQKTLKLLQGGIGYILEQSAIDPSTDHAGRIRATERQALLMDILEENRSNLFDSDDDEVEVEELQPENGKDYPQMFHKKQPRYASIDSMMSEIASIDPRDMILPPSHSRKQSVQRAARDLTSSVPTQGRAARSRRSKYYLAEDQEERLRSRSLSTHGRSEASSAGSYRGRNRRHDSSSGGSSRRGRVRRSRSLSSSDTSGQHHAVAHKGGLRTMLESLRGGGEDDAGSQDTPRTTNTPGGGTK